MKEKLQLSLVGLRFTVFLVMFMWTLDKFINPVHAAHVYKKFYFLPSFEPFLMYTLGAVEMLILFMFLLGLQKKYSYGAVLLFHTISTLSSLKQYLTPFDGVHLLFFAAWPMLAACLTLFLLQDEDIKLTV
ncbi:hypothetical protein KCG35_10555 [Zooshikella sp. WH53]|uniref:DoxX family membrane protein n=2 Tax=Zooshikella harenae TaxID=2827238 RepID=A0ABS5ZBR4_9GAMM|nr:hypothetical protein [Zooshikella harenae]